MALYKDIQDELERVKEEILQIENSYRKANKLKIQGEYQACLWMLRNTLEGICKNVHKNETSNNSADLELRQVIKYLEESSIIPSHILPHIRSVQTFGNFGSHLRSLGSLEEVHIQPALASMEVIFAWFIKEYHGCQQSEYDVNELTTLKNLCKYYEDDKAIGGNFTDTKQYIGSDSIIIVLGSHTACELFDRLPAELLRNKVDEWGDYKLKRRALIITDVWYKRDEALKNKRIISIGGQFMNDISGDILLSGGFREEVTLSTSNCTIYSSEGNYVFNYSTPGSSLEAVLKFIRSKEGLSAFLKSAWKE